MCSRFWGAIDGQRVLTSVESGDFKIFLQELLDASNLTWNVAPTEWVGGIVSNGSLFAMRPLKWGFTIPGKQPVINARIESVLEKPMFRNATVDRRCLILARGFYEWNESKQPHAIRRIDEEPMAFGGLWRTRDETSEFVVCTTEPNSTIAQIHDRMPVIVAESDWRSWLTGDSDNAVANATAPNTLYELEVYPVGRQMANPRYKGADSPLPQQDLFSL